MNKNSQIEETIEQLTQLVETQDKAIETARAIISLKNKLIEICEEETDFYRKQNSALKESLIVCGVILVIDAILIIIQLAV